MEAGPDKSTAKKPLEAGSPHKKKPSFLIEEIQANILEKQGALFGFKCHKLDHKIGNDKHGQPHTTLWSKHVSAYVVLGRDANGHSTKEVLGYIYIDCFGHHDRHKYSKMSLSIVPSYTHDGKRRPPSSLFLGNLTKTLNQQTGKYTVDAEALRVYFHEVCRRSHSSICGHR